MPTTQPSAQDRYVAANSKPLGIAVSLAVALGPVGALYASPVGGTILLLITLATAGYGLMLTWPLAVLVAVRGVDRSRERARAAAGLNRRGAL